jgi:lysophospholipase L1-like esterase
MIADRYPNRALYVRTATGKRLRRDSRVLIRNHALSRADVEIRTNSLGFRYGELDAKKETDLRVLVLGDSVTFSDYTAYEDTFTAVMERILDEHFLAESSGRNAQVVNAGIGGVDVQTELAILLESGLSVEPDVVVVALYLNDAYTSFDLEVSRLPRVARWSRFLAMIFRRVDVLRAQTLYRTATGDPGQRMVELLNARRRLGKGPGTRQADDMRPDDGESTEPDAIADGLREVDTEIAALFRRHGSLFPNGNRIVSELDAIDVSIAKAGSSPDSAGLRRLEARRRRLREDLVQAAASIRRETITSEYETAKETFLRNHEISKRSWKGSDSGFNRLIADAFDDWGYAWSESCWEKIGHIMTLMKDVSRDHDFELVVALLPVRYQVQSRLNRNEPQRHFRELMQALDLEHIDLLPGLRAAYAEDRRNLYYDHCHYRPEGNELIGEEIASFLISEVLPEEGRSSAARPRPPK